MEERTLESADLQSLFRSVHLLSFGKSSLVPSAVRAVVEVLRDDSALD
jgi:hypothetical protein